MHFFYVLKIQLSSMIGILVLKTYSILLKELCLLGDKSISALGIPVLARRNRKTLVMWARGNGRYDYVSEKNEVLPQSKKSP